MPIFRLIYSAELHHQEAAGLKRTCFPITLPVYDLIKFNSFCQMWVYLGFLSCMKKWVCECPVFSSQSESWSQLLLLPENLDFKDDGGAQWDMFPHLKPLPPNLFLLLWNEGNAFTGRIGDRWKEWRLPSASGGAWKYKRPEYRRDEA